MTTTQRLLADATHCERQAASWEASERAEERAHAAPWRDRAVALRVLAGQPDRHSEVDAKDAARYRWWRAHWLTPGDDGLEVLNATISGFSTEAELDAAIDTAIGPAGA